MSETRFPPPSGTSGAGHAGHGVDKPLFQNVLVTQAPASVTQGSAAKTLLLDGRVTGNNPARGETTFSTAKGDIVVQTGGSLPVGTDVSIDLRMQNLSLRANITVLRQKSSEMKAAQDIGKPASTTPPADSPDIPPIKTGDRLIALRLPQEVPPAVPAVTTPPVTPTPPTTAPAPAVMPGNTPDPALMAAPPKLTLEQAAQIIEAARAAIGIARLPTALPAVPPVPLPVLWQILNTRDVMIALVKLPEAMQTQILDFLARPDITAALRQALPPMQAQTLLPQMPVTAADAQDLAQAQMAVRSAPQTPTPATPAQNPAQPMMSIPFPAGGFMGGLLPMIENMLGQGIMSPMQMMAGKLPQLTPGMGNLPLPQNMFQLVVQQIIPPTPAGAQPSNLAQGIDPAADGTPDMPPQIARPLGSIIATVESLTPSGMPVLRTPDAHFVLRQAAALPVGTQIIFTLAPAQAGDILGPTAPMTRDPFFFDPLFSRGWPALDEALSLLGGGAAQAAQALAQTIPTATARLAPTTLFFLAALRMGSIESWLGENTLQSIRSGGRKDVAERLAQDFGRIAAQSKTLIAGEWRAITMPLMQQDQHISMIQFFVRPQQDDDDTSGSETATAKKMTRFILNLQLSRMGDMQLDGLLHQKRFDLILRSEDRLPGDIRQELMQRFAAGLEQTGMEGGISFQTRAENWVRVSAGGDTVTA